MLQCSQKFVLSHSRDFGHNIEKTLINTLMKIQSILNKPHPFIFNRFSVLLPTLITFFLLLVLKPFEFAEFSMEKLFIRSAIFGVLVGVSVIASVAIIKKIFPQSIDKKWTVGKEILLFLFVLANISLVVFVLLLWFKPQTDWGSLFVSVVIRTLAISVFPIIVLVLYEQNYHQRKRRKEAEKINKELAKKQAEQEEKLHVHNVPSKLILVAENKKPNLQIVPTDLFYVKSEGNYVEVFYRQNQKFQKELIRNSLKAIEEQLPVTHFFRCHNRFLINLTHLIKVEGNARNLELNLENIEEKIPVSRNKSEVLLKHFQQKVL